jgi:hypothetical protein
VSQTLLAIEAKSLKTTVAQHLHDLSVLLALLLEDELTLLIVVLVLTTTTVLTALFSNCQFLYVICAVCKHMELEVSPFAISIQPQVAISEVENSWGDGGGATHSKEGGAGFFARLPFPCSWA